MNQSALLRLMLLLSPSFPVGGFAYSHGLEQAAVEGQTKDAAALGEWLRSLIAHGSQWNDAVLLAQAHKCAADGPALTGIAELAEALAGSKERHLEQQNLGSAFISAAKAAGLAMPAALGARAAYSVAVGAAAAAQGIGVVGAAVAFLHGFASNQTQCGIRLGILGQAAAVRLLAEIEPVILETAQRASAASLDDLGSNTISAEIASMRHETLHSRIFRS